MKFLLCVLLIAVALSSISAGRIRRSGWYPSYSYGYGYSAPVVYSSYPSSYSGWSGRGWNNGWNSGWKGGWW